MNECGARLHKTLDTTEAVQWKQTGKPARVFTDFLHRTKKTKTGGWDRERRVAAKAEHIDGKENPRFVVTSLTGERWAARELYEELYCERGNMKTASKSSSACSPTASVRRRSVPIRCVYICRPSPARISTPPLPHNRTSSSRRHLLTPAHSPNRPQLFVRSKNQTARPLSVPLFSTQQFSVRNAR